MNFRDTVLLVCNWSNFLYFYMSIYYRSILSSINSPLSYRFFSSINSVLSSTNSSIKCDFLAAAFVHLWHLHIIIGSVKCHYFPTCIRPTNRNINMTIWISIISLVSYLCSIVIIRCSTVVIRTSSSCRRVFQYWFTKNILYNLPVYWIHIITWSCINTVSLMTNTILLSLHLY